MGIKTKTRLSPIILFLLMVSLGPRPPKKTNAIKKTVKEAI